MDTKQPAQRERLVLLRRSPDVRSGAVEWWRSAVVAGVEHVDVIARVDEDAVLSGHFVFMTVISAGIAILGLLLSSPAVVIGAMLISPLMGPIIGVGFGVALFDLAETRRSLITFMIGVAVAVAFTAMIVLVSPIQEVTSEIAARTRPNLFDLGVAVLSGLAGTYAMVRGRHGAIVGVAIAVALMPPLAVVGYGLATWNARIFWGALLLFVTNFVAIALSAAALARVYGFGHQLSPRQTWLQATLIIGFLAALAVPLGIALRQIAWEALATRETRDVIARQFGADARVAQLDLDFGGEPLRITATIFTPKRSARAEQVARKALAASLDRQIDLHLDQIQVGTAAADAAQLAAARAGSSQSQFRQMPDELALVAGVPAAQVIIDPENRVAQVRAQPLPGAELAAYRILEERARVLHQGWDIRLIPPISAPLPTTSSGSDIDSEEVQGALQTVIWAASRLKLPVSVSGSAREEISSRLRASGIDSQPSGRRFGETRFEWRTQ
jgi:uncharacterized hydrophobic protein (TIGR00271 family)